MKITRRKLAGAALASAALAQTPPHPPSTPEDELKAAKEQGRRTSEALAKQKIPMATEPAFIFKA